MERIEIQGRNRDIWRNGETGTERRYREGMEIQKGKELYGGHRDKYWQGNTVYVRKYKK